MRGGLTTIGRSVRLRLSFYRGASVARGSGFTIVETLSVLGGTGALFLSAAVMISGRRNQTAFDQAIRQVQSQIQQAINEVGVGYFPNSGNFQCAAGAAGQPPKLDAGGSGQGTNSGCIFLGKALQFKVANTTPESFAIYTIAGLKKGGGGGTLESASLSEARPMVVAPSSPSHTNLDYPDNSVNEQLQGGLKVVRMWYNNGGGDQEIGAVAFVNSLAQYSSGNIVSGAGQVSMVAIPGTSLDQSKLDAVEIMNNDAGNAIANGIINPTGGIYVCFDSGGTNQYGIVKIGGESRELAVTLAIKDKDPSSTQCTP